MCRTEHFQKSFWGGSFFLSFHHRPLHIQVAYLYCSALENLIRNRHQVYPRRDTLYSRRMSKQEVERRNFSGQNGISVFHLATNQTLIGPFFKKNLGSFGSIFGLKLEIALLDVGRWEHFIVMFDRMCPKWNDRLQNPFF